MQPANRMRGQVAPMSMRSPDLGSQPHPKRRGPLQCLSPWAARTQAASVQARRGSCLSLWFYEAATFTSRKEF